MREQLYCNLTKELKRQMPWVNKGQINCNLKFKLGNLPPSPQPSPSRARGLSSPPRRGRAREGVDVTRLFS